MKRKTLVRGWLDRPLSRTMTVVLGAALLLGLSSALTHADTPARIASFNLCADQLVAVLADPFAVSLHSVTRHPPPPGGRVLVWGAGSLGSCAVAILRALHPDVEVGVVARFDTQARRPVL